jgi:hypothetical protein
MFCTDIGSRFCGLRECGEEKALGGAFPFGGKVLTIQNISGYWFLVETG